MPLLPADVAESGTGEFARPLRRDSPNEGSKESGRGVVVRRVGFGLDGFPSLAVAVIHERRRRMAWSKEGNRSRAVRLMWISSLSVRLSNSSLGLVPSLAWYFMNESSASC